MFPKWTALTVHKERKRKYSTVRLYGKGANIVFLLCTVFERIDSFSFASLYARFSVCLRQREESSSCVYCDARLGFPAARCQRQKDNRRPQKHHTSEHIWNHMEFRFPFPLSLRFFYFFFDELLYICCQMKEKCWRNIRNICSS